MNVIQGIKMERLTAINLCTPVKKICPLVLSSLLVGSILTACSGGGDSGSSLPTERSSVAITGNAVDAIITNGTIRAYSWADGIKGDLLAEAKTDDKGFYTLNVQSPNQPLLIEVTNGRYTEEASGVNVDLLEGQAVRSLIQFEQDKDINVQVNPYSHLASCLADFKVKQGANEQNAIIEATSAFSGLVGVDVIGTYPKNITDPENANFEVTDELRFGALLAGISSYTATISQENGVTPHRFNQNSSMYFLQVACQDISADGLLNGMGYINGSSNVGQLALGSVLLNTESYRLDIPQHILVMMSSERNATGLDVGQFLQFANGIALSTDSMFPNETPKPVDQTGPVMTTTTQEGSYLKGIVDIGFEITDPLGLNSVEYSVNGSFVSMGQTNNPVLSINTLGYSDGTLNVTVIAKDALDNESTRTFTYEVANTASTVSLTSPTLVNTRAYTAAGTYQLNGAPVSSITVNGTPAVINADSLTWSADIVLNSGPNEIELIITDTANNVGVNIVDIDVDLIKPTASIIETNTIFTTFQGQLNLCTSGIFDRTSAFNNPACISTDNISLNGTAIDLDLHNVGYLLIAFSPEDPTGAGTFTQRENLTVEYKYEKDTVEKVGWTAVPKPNQGSSYYLPVVTEYLGDDWYQTTTDEVHKVTIRVTDEAGNSTIEEWRFKVDVLIPAVTVSSKMSNEVLFTSANFSNRTNIDGQLVNVEYTLDNPSNTAYYISMSDAQNHSVAHTYESKVRKNKARLVTTDEQRFIFSGGSGSWETPVTVYNGQGAAIATTTIMNGAYTDFFLDNPTASAATEWIAKTYADLCTTGTVGTIGFQTVTYFGLFNTATAYQTVQNNSVLTTGYAGAVNNGFTGGGCSTAATRPYYGSNLDWESRSRYAYQMQEGYPRNESTNISVNSAMMTQGISVFNNSLGQEIFPINGWYRVPPITTVKIVKSVRTPILLHYTDSEVSSSTFTSYTEKELDLTTTWIIDADFELTRAIDPGDPSKLSQVTQTTETIGLGSKAYTVSR